MKFTQAASTLLAFTGLANASLLPEERAGAIGTTHRFSSTFPKGIGSGSPSDMTTILNVTEVTTGIAALVKEYCVTSFATHYKTFEGRTVMGIKVGGSRSGANTDYHIYLNGGIHARERTSHDSVLYFIADLLYAQKQGTGLIYDKNTYTNAQDNSCWRKNRNTNSGKSGASVGVDSNRNFDFVWHLSGSPSSEVFQGTAAFSEPETQDMKYVLDTFTKVRWYIDLHSIGGITSDSTSTKYGEYISTTDLNNLKTVGSAPGSALTSAAGRPYTLMHDDYAFSRSFVDSSKNKVYSYTVEFGFANNALSCPFYITDATYTPNLQEIGSGYMNFILAAIDVGFE
ncbi:zinc carboxypeptidase [Xylariaceae sp. FL0255]|nr:zinc carboxypeptidase [Xylariaceae sp. FL0255]